MKEPVDHILRPLLPWRIDGGLTECGLEGSNAITRQQYFARLKDLGQQRTAMLTCMTCANTAANWKSWDEDPREAVGREVAWEKGFSRVTGRRGGPLKHELMAIAALIEAHKDEFADLVQEVADRDEWIKRKEAASAPKPKRPRAW